MIPKTINEMKQEEVLKNIADTVFEFWDTDCVADCKEAFVSILEELGKVGIVKTVQERTLTNEECAKINEDQV